MTENKAEFCNKLCELLRMTGNLGSQTSNPIVELRYIKKDNGDEIVRPLFKSDPNRSDGYYDVNVTGDNCMGILTDVYNHFIKHF